MFTPPFFLVGMYWETWTKEFDPDIMFEYIVASRDKCAPGPYILMWGNPLAQ